MTFVNLTSTYHGVNALGGAFNQEKALVGAFSVIVQPVVEPMDRFTALLQGQSRGASQVQETRQSCGECLSQRRKLFATTSMYFRICFPANKQCVCESLLEPEEQSGKHL